MGYIFSLDLHKSMTEKVCFLIGILCSGSDNAEDLCDGDFGMKDCFFLFHLQFSEIDNWQRK